MDNQALAQGLLQLARGYEFLDEPFRARAYGRAAQAVAGLERSVEEYVRQDRVHAIPGIGRGIAALLSDWIMRQDFTALNEMASRLPQGLDELLKVPGLGMKTIRRLFEEREIAGLEDLIAAVNDGRLAGQRGFSAARCDRLRDQAQVVMQYRGKITLDTAWHLAAGILGGLEGRGLRAEVSGALRRGALYLEEIDLVVQDLPGLAEHLETVLGPGGVRAASEGVSIYDRPGPVPIRIHPAAQGDFTLRHFLCTGSAAHVASLVRLAGERGYELDSRGLRKDGRRVALESEEALYATLGLQYLPPETREGRPLELEYALAFALPPLVESGDLRGVLHVHSTYSDGRSELADLVQAARERGYSWIGITDHSQSAAYAGGMPISRLTGQQEEIAALNRSQSDIRVLSGVECDILPDGSLDYPDEVLERCDFVIASVHSHMDMDESAMTRRMLRAIEHPCTRILAHPTGRLLLAREPYAVDMHQVMAAAAAHRVAIEVNAHPIRLDLDWHLIPDFLSRGGMLALCPDAHEIRGLDDLRYGVTMARKGLASREACLNTLDGDGIRAWFRRGVG